MLDRSLRILLMVILATLSALIPVSADANTYEVSSSTDLCYAIQHATNGDTIIFKSSGPFNLYTLSNTCRYTNENGNGQYLSSGYWGIYNITLVLQAEQGVIPSIIGQYIIFGNAHASVISNLNLSVSVFLFGTNDMTISDNIFSNGAVLELGGNSSNFIIQNNMFVGGGGIVVDDSPGIHAEPGAVDGNTVNGHPLVYMDTSCGDVSGDVGQVVAVGCQGGVNIHDINFTSLQGSHIPIIISNTDGVTIRNVHLGYSSDVNILKSSNVVIDASTFIDTYIDIYESSHVLIKNNEITNKVVHIEKSVDVLLLDNIFNANENNMLHLVSAELSDSITIEKNQFLINGEYYALIDISGCNNTLVQLNDLTALTPLSDYDHFIRIKEYYNSALDKYYYNYNVIVKNNILTGKPVLRYDTVLPIGKGIFVSRANNTIIENNTLNWIGHGISVAGNNTRIINNTIYNTDTAISISGNKITVSYNKGENIGFSALSIDTIKSGIVNNNNFKNFTSLFANPLNLYDRIDNLTITGNIFEGIMGNHLIDLDGVEGNSIHIYLNAFLGDFASSWSLVGVLDECSGITNETFRSPGLIDYVYGNNLFRGYVGNYYEGYEGNDTDNNGIRDEPVYLVYLGGGNDIYDNYPINDISIVYQYINHTAIQQPPSGGGSGANETEEEMENETIIIPMLTQEQREAIEKAEEVNNLIENATNNIGAHGLSSEEIREILENIGIENMVDQLYHAGVINKIVPLTESEKNNLRDILTSLYGPLLENYPTTVGRIYLLYLLYL